jgi:LysM repeat protein
MADGSPSDLSQHVVKKGETLLSIAKKLNVTRADLAEANYLPLTAKLKIGDTLIVPRAPDSRRPPVSTTLASNKPAESVASLWDAPGLAKLVHLVRPGDTVDSIARAYRTTAAALREWNGLLANSLVPGQELTIFASTAP